MKKNKNLRDKDLNKDGRNYSKTGEKSNVGKQGNRKNISSKDEDVFNEDLEKNTGSRGLGGSRNM